MLLGAKEQYEFLTKLGEGGRCSCFSAIIPDAIRHVVRVCGGCGVLDLNGPEVDCLLCQWGGFAPYWGPRGAHIQYLICKKIGAP